MESITLCAFSWPISTALVSFALQQARLGLRRKELVGSTHAGNSQPHFAGGSDRCCAPSGRSWNRA